MLSVLMQVLMIVGRGGRSSGSSTAIRCLRRSAVRSSSFCRRPRQGSSSRGSTIDPAATFTKGVAIPELTFICFQMTFACITPALIVGAFAERIKFWAVMLFVVLWVTFVYFPIAHMVGSGRRTGLIFTLGRDSTSPAARSSTSMPVSPV